MRGAYHEQSRAGLPNGLAFTCGRPSAADRQSAEGS